jgi:6-phosphogluconolactonase/glucosamine-6-phosphate isomerase/deaminase
MNKKQFEKEFKERQHQQQLKSLDANRNRAQSVSIGLSGGGTTEITMRGVDGTFL